MRQLEPKVYIPVTGKILFRFYYETEGPQNILYQEADSEMALPINLDVYNNSSDDIEIILKKPDNKEVSKDNYHFRLSFPPGLLADLGEAEVESDEWDMASGAEPESEDIKELGDNRLNIFFLHKTGRPISKDSVDKVSFLFSKLCAKTNYGSPTAKVYIVCSDLMSYTKGEEEYTLKGKNWDQEIRVEDRNAKSNIPLHVGFVGSNTVLNDGTTPNSLTLRITNVSSSDSLSPNLTFTQESKLIVSFETGEKDSKYWALADAGKVKAITIGATESSTWQVQEKENRKEWEVLLQGGKAPYELEPGKNIELKLGNIVTEHPTGKANLYVRYEEIEGYQNGVLAVPIEKTPMRVRGEKVEVYGIVQAGVIEGVGALVPGMIIMWHGAQDQIPDGWSICDGSRDEVPDLRGLFIIGAKGEEIEYKQNHGAEAVEVREENLPKIGELLRVKEVAGHTHKMRFIFKEELHERNVEGSRDWKRTYLTNHPGCDNHKELMRTIEDVANTSWGPDHFNGVHYKPWSTMEGLEDEWMCFCYEKPTQTYSNLFKASSFDVFFLLQPRESAPTCPQANPL
ncbi:MAG: tail fiber protein [Symploca sp. SIO2E9]|nr:tail fiber protein [Symploca sp. SIO2E9]